MLASIRQVTIGQATVSVINIGDIHLPFAQYMNVPDAEQHHHGLANQTRAPIHSIHIQLPNRSVMVDAGLYDIENYTVYALSDYTPPPPLIEQLASINVKPEDIDDVILTHRHWDHINATTTKKDGDYVPQFPNATYYLGQDDWERSEANRNDPFEVEYSTLRILDKQGVLQLITQPYGVGEHLEIIPASGETHGHQIVKLQSAGETLFVLGDMYHHPIEFRNKTWMVQWANSEMTLSSREMFLQQALATNAILVATHIPQIGRVVTTDDGGKDWETMVD